MNACDWNPGEPGTGITTKPRPRQGTAFLYIIRTDTHLQEFKIENISYELPDLEYDQADVVEPTVFVEEVEDADLGTWTTSSFH